MANRTEWVSVRSSRASIVLVLVLVLVPVLAACADSHRGPQGGGKSTETGNPPVIDVDRVALVVQSDEVHVVGKQGAVTPGGIDVEVTNLATDEVSRGDVARDGSFDVQVDGTLDDTYELRAVSGEGASERSEPIYLYRGGASVSSPDGGSTDVTAECDERAQVIQGEFASAQNAADLRCDSNLDCGRTGTAVRCPAALCTGTIVSHAGEAELMSVLDGIAADACASFAADGCWNGWRLPNCVFPPPAIACIDGQCTSCDEQDCPETSCGDCVFPDVRWSTRNAGAAATPMEMHSLTGCSTYTFTSSAGDQCSRELPCIGAGGAWSFAHLQNALGDPVVRTALANNAIFGSIVPAGAYTLQLEVGTGSLLYTGTECGSQDPCTEAPRAVDVLDALLTSIAGEQSCGRALCSVPFDPGVDDGSGGTQVYAFDIETGACVPQVFFGGTGNANRFETIDDCRASCPGTASAGTCGSGRQFVPDTCLLCGSFGLCSVNAPICAKTCASASDCADELGGGRCSPEGVCLQQLCE